MLPLSRASSRPRVSSSSASSRRCWWRYDWARSLSACASRSFRSSWCAISSASSAMRSWVAKSPSHQAMRARTSSAVKRPSVGSASRAASISSVAFGRFASRSSATSASAVSASALDRAVAGRARLVEHAAHLDRDRRQVAQPPRRARRVVAAFERRLELDRSEEQLAGGAVRLAGERAPACLFERGRRLVRELGRSRTVELGEQLRRRGRGGTRGSRAARRPPAPGATRRTAGAARRARPWSARSTRPRGSACA